MVKILCVSDTHVGGRYSVSSQYGGKIQRFFYEKWEEMCDSVGQVDAVFHLGDVCEGIDKKNDGTGTWEADLLNQAKDAKTLMEMVKSKKYWFVDGTPYHTNRNMSADGVVAELLNGWFGVEHLVKVKGVSIHLRHFTPFSELPHTAGNGLGKDMLWAELNKEQYGKIDLMIRGHVHRIEGKFNKNVTAMTVPCWKTRDDFIKQKSLNNVDNGYLVLEVDGSSYAYDRVTFDVPKDYLIAESKL